MIYRKPAFLSLLAVLAIACSDHGPSKQEPLHTRHLNPDGTPRLYAQGRFNTDPDHAEDYGHDLATGASLTEEEMRAKEPRGRAFLKPADYHRRRR